MTDEKKDRRRLPEESAFGGIFNHRRNGGKAFQGKRAVVSRKGR